MRPLDPARAHQGRAVPASRVRMPVSILRTAPAPIDPVIRELARDRLRDLHDDGVTMAYIGRMYGVSADRMREIEAGLKR